MRQKKAKYNCYFWILLTICIRFVDKEAKHFVTCISTLSENNFRSALEKKLQFSFYLKSKKYFNFDYVDDEDDQDILKESYGGKSLQGEILNQGAAADDEILKDF